MYVYSDINEINSSRYIINESCIIMDDAVGFHDEESITTCQNFSS